MRYHVLRFDIWLCLLVSVLLSMIPAKILENTMPKSYENYVEEHEVSDGEIGGIAGEDVFRAQNVEDLLSHDTFTIVSPGIEYRNKGAGYYSNFYMYAVTLPSGERVAARVNGDKVQKTGETIYDGDSILPVGKVVYEDLTQDTYFLNQIEYKEELSRKDFFVDMVGEGGVFNQQDYTELPIIFAQLITIFVTFPIAHYLGSKFGIFPYFFPPREKKETEETEAEDIKML